MRHLLMVLALAPTLCAGCLSPGDEPSWRKPGLAGGKVSEAFSSALRETDEEMKMSEDRTSQPRRSTKLDSDY
jgi:hypothetical protein